jgi:hypothetical protein
MITIDLRISSVFAPFCEGTGQDPRSIEFSKCPTCQGSGSNTVPESWPQCSHCKTPGRIPISSSLGGIFGPVFKPCPICGGKGYSSISPNAITNKISNEETNMTNKQKILDFFTNHQESYDDDQLSELLKIEPRQQVNSICKQLEKEGNLQRKLLTKIHNQIKR